jgi:hypothetical protein
MYLISNILSMPVDGLFVRLFCVYDLFKLITDAILTKQVASHVLLIGLKVIEAVLRERSDSLDQRFEASGCLDAIEDLQLN